MLLTLGFSTRAQVTEGLVLHYPMNGNLIDVGGNAFDGIGAGMTPSEDRFGNSCGALEIDSKADGIQIGPWPFGELTNPLRSDSLSISLWYQFGNISTWWNTLIYGSQSRHHLLIGYRNSEERGQPGFYDNVNGGFVFNSEGPPLNVGSWYHFVVVMCPSGYDLFINDTLRFHSNQSWSNASFPNYTIDSSSSAQGAIGKLDDVRIYNRCLSKDEITGLFQAQSEELNCGFGTLCLSDEFMFNGKLVEPKDSVLGEVTANLTLDRLGRRDSALQTGENAMIQFEDMDLPYDQDVSISVWFKPDLPGQGESPDEEKDGVIYSDKTDTNALGSVIIWNNGQLKANHIIDGQEFEIDYHGSFSRESWHLFTLQFRYQEHKLLLYVDGELTGVDSQSVVKLTQVPVRQRVCLGSNCLDQSHSFFRGKVDDVVIQECLVSEQDIISWYFEDEYVGTREGVMLSISGEPEFCLGDSVELIASGEGPFEWYNFRNFNEIIHVGDTFKTVLFYPEQYLVQDVEGNLASFAFHQGTGCEDLSILGPAHFCADELVSFDVQLTLEDGDSEEDIIWFVEHGRGVPVNRGSSYSLFPVVIELTVMVNYQDRWGVLTTVNGGIAECGEEQILVDKPFFCPGELVTFTIDRDSVQWEFGLEPGVILDTGRMLSFYPQQPGTYQAKFPPEYTKSIGRYIALDSNCTDLEIFAQNGLPPYCLNEERIFSVNGTAPTSWYVYSDTSAWVAEGFEVTIPMTGASSLIAQDASGQSDTFNLTGLTCPPITINNGESLGAPCRGDQLALFVEGVEPVQWFEIHDTLTFLNEGTVMQLNFENSLNLVVVDASGQSDTLFIEASPDLQCNPLKVYELITPDNDGYNDVLYVDNLEYYNGVNLVVSDALGKIVFETEDYHNEWDGGELPSGLLLSFENRRVSDERRSFTEQVINS